MLTTRTTELFFICLLNKETTTNVERGSDLNRVEGVGGKEKLGFISIPNGDWQRRREKCEDLIRAEQSAMSSSAERRPPTTDEWGPTASLMMCVCVVDSLSVCLSLYIDLCRVEIEEGVYTGV